MKTRHWLMFGAIMLVALGFRLYLAWGRGIWYDDAFSYFLAKQDLANIIKGTAADTEPPLYYFMLHFWLKLGESVFAMRLLGILFSMATIFFVFDIGRRLAGVEAGLSAALITAVMPFQIYHAQELRMYTLLALTLSMYLWFFIRIYLSREKKRPTGLWIGLILTGTLSIYAQTLAVFGLILPDIYLLLKTEWKKLRDLVISQVITMILALPWLMMIPGQITKIQTAFYTPRPEFLEVLQALLQYSMFLPVTGAVLVIASLLTVQSMVIVALETWKMRKTPGVGLLVTVWLGLPILLFIVSYGMRPIFVPRGFIFSMLAYAVLAGWIIAKRWKTFVGPFLLIASLSATLLTLPSLYTFSAFPRSPIQAATQYLTEQSVSSDLILHDNKLSFFPSHFYNPALEQSFLADEPGSHNDTYALASQEAIGLYPSMNVADLTVNKNRVWFVVFQKAIQEYKDMGTKVHPVIANLEQTYQLIDQREFGDLIVMRFER